MRTPAKTRLATLGVLLSALLFVVSCETGGESARAVATRISTQSQLIGGPKALGSIGDYLLENDKIRVIIHGPGPNRGTTMYPGMIIDADLQRPQGSQSRGRDQIGELTPAFLFETFNPTSFEVVSDGSDGGAAVVRVEGVGDDFLEQISVLNAGLLFPQGLGFAVEYRLEPGNQYIEIATTIINTSSGTHPFPFLNPPELRDLGLDIPGLEDLELSVPLGLFGIFGGENEIFAPGPTGFNIRFSVEDSYLEAGGLPAFPGIVADFIATRADGVSYAITVPEVESNYVSQFAEYYEGQKVTPHSLLIPFLFSSVTAIFHTNTPDQLAPGEAFTYSTYLTVGRGDVASAAEVVYDIHNIETGSFGGRVLDSLTGAPVVGAMIMVKDKDGNYVTQLDTDQKGYFDGKMPPGDYRYQVVTRERDPSPAKEIVVRANQQANAIINLYPPATVSVQVRDEAGRALPSKVTLVARFPESQKGKDPRDFLYDLSLGESVRPTTFDPNRNEYVEAAWYEPDGVFSRRIRPGEYDLYVSRGVEFDLYKESIVLGSGEYWERQVTLKQSVDTRGWISTDTHMHSKNSVDSGLSLEDRVISIAGEGVEYVAATDHNFVTDYAPAIASTGLVHWLLSSVGVEVTTFEMGHFNGYPLKLNAGSIRGGDVVWAGQRPQEIFDQIRDLGAYGREDTIVQINHPRWEFLGYFNVFNLSQDTGENEERTGLLSVFAPIGEEYELDNFSLDFEVVEILNGKRLDVVHSYRVPDELPEPPLPEPEDIPPAGEILRKDNGTVAFPGAMEDWFVMLNRGVRFTGIGASDSHKTLGDEPGFPRTYVYVGEDSDGIGQFTERQVIDGLRAHRAVLSMGPFVEFFINEQPIGSDLRASSGEIDMRIEVQAPNFSPVNEIIVYGNGEEVLREAIPEGSQQRYTFTTSLDLTEDTWFIVEVRGDANLFPIATPTEFEPLSPDAVITGLGASFDLSALTPFGNLAPYETFAVTPLAITNPIWVDIDGGGFDPSFAPGTGTTVIERKQPEMDVRAIFDSIPDLQQREEQQQ